MREFFKIISPDNESVEFYYNGTKVFKTTEETEKGEVMGPHIGDKPDNFKDIWDTENDLARVWGTKEYFQRVDRDGWHTGKDSFADKTQRIKRKADEDIRRIKADAERIKRDARRIAENARSRAVEELRGTHTHTVSGSFDWKNLTKPTPPPRFIPSKKIFFKNRKKKKRRFKLSSKSGGITLGGSLFWMFIMYQCFFAGNDKDEKTAEVTSTTDKVIEQVQTTIDNIKPEAQALFDKAKAEFGKVVKEEKSIPKVSDNNDPFARDDSRYESIEDKW